MNDDGRMNEIMNTPLSLFAKQLMKQARDEKGTTAKVYVFEDAVFTVSCIIKEDEGCDDE